MFTSNNTSEFKNLYSHELRSKESCRILVKYPDRIPIVCEVRKNDRNSIFLDKNKYLVPSDLTVGQFLYVIRKRIKLPPEKAIFIFVNNALPPTASLMSQIYSEHRDSDGFLYMLVSCESTFGNASK